jgi:hypothetical protein
LSLCMQAVIAAVAYDYLTEAAPMDLQDREHPRQDSQAGYRFYSLLSNTGGTARFRGFTQCSAYQDSSRIALLGQPPARSAGP